MKSGEVENKSSMRGMKQGKEPHKGEGSVKSIEHVGSKHSENHAFRMPKDSEVSDHSKVKGLM